MNDKLILDTLISKLLEENMWFTTKNDPTFNEAPNYYELDQYGDLTDKSSNQIIKEIKAKLGDGAVEIIDAVDLWLTEALSDYKVAYEEDLVTNFENKPVVDNIEAYPVKLESKQNNKSNFIAIYFRNNPQLENGGYYTTKRFENVTEKQAEKQAEKITNSVYGSKTLLDIIPEEKYEGPAVGTTFHEKEYKELKKSQELKTESYKKRLEEQNTTSSQLIDSKFAEEDFDEESDAGQIIIKTSELFNNLSEKNYDVEVSFDNGESLSKIILGQQGGTVQITINDADKPLKAYIAGNIEINNDNIKSFTDILDIINNI